MTEFSFVLPAYNEESNIAEAIARAEKFLTRRFKNYEIIVVNDGSRDRTGLILAALTKQSSALRVINHAQNKGYGAAVWDGLQAARGDLVFFTDSDLQFCLDDLNLFLQEIKINDLVIGYRARRSEGIVRRLNAFGWKTLVRAILGVCVRDVDCAFKLFRRDVLSDLKINSSGATFSAELLYLIQQNKYKTKELPVKHFPRRHGQATGANLKVIIKGFKELHKLRKIKATK